MSDKEKNIYSYVDSYGAELAQALIDVAKSVREKDFIVAQERLLELHLKSNEYNNFVGREPLSLEEVMKTVNFFIKEANKYYESKLPFIEKVQSTVSLAERCVAELDALGGIRCGLK